MHWGSSAAWSSYFHWGRTPCWHPELPGGLDCGLPTLPGHTTLIRCDLSRSGFCPCIPHSFCCLHHLSPPQVLKLLLVAWDRRLIFAIGTSSTTGESDTVIWNEIHHKTEFGSNLTGHGYPDINYLDNVLAELAAQGITEESLAQEKD